MRELVGGLCLQEIDHIIAQRQRGIVIDKNGKCSTTYLSRAQLNRVQLRIVGDFN